MVNYSISDICCPPSYDEEPRYLRWFFKGLLIFIFVMVVFIIIGLTTGLWHSSKSEKKYLILVRKWPVTYCLIRPCKKINSTWIIHGFYPTIEGKQLKNCNDNGKHFSEELINEQEKDLAKRWPNILQEKDHTSISTTITLTTSDNITKNSTDNTSNENLIHWKNQWKLYGICSSMNQTQYFNETLNLDLKYELDSNGLLLKKFKPDLNKSIPLKDIIKEIMNVFKNISESMIEFICLKTYDVEFGERYFLEQIRICFDVSNFKPVECYKSFFESPKNCFGAKYVFYPNSLQ